MAARLQQIIMTIIATLAFWFAVGMIDMVTMSSDTRDAAAIIAFLVTLMLWTILALTPPKTAAKAEKSAKTKRSASGTPDDRLALLLNLMTEDERHTLQTRLADELTGDGEISLADLLAAQDNEAMFREKAP